MQGVIAIDGKTLRRSFDRAAPKSPLHLVSAWAAGSRLLLGQVATDQKSNEIKGTLTQGAIEVSLTLRREK